MGGAPAGSAGVVPALSFTSAYLNQNTINLNISFVRALLNGWKPLPSRREGVNQTGRQSPSPGPTECSSRLAQAEFRRIPCLLRLDFSTAKRCQEVLVLAESNCPTRALTTEVITGWMAQPLGFNRRVEVDERLDEMLPFAL